MNSLVDEIQLKEERKLVCAPWEKLSQNELAKQCLHSRLRGRGATVCGVKIRAIGKTLVSGCSYHLLLKENVFITEILRVAKPVKLRSNTMQIL